MSLARLDHLICRVPDIRAAHRDLTGRLRFAEAWPVGPFWAGALTSGVAVGGLNVELLQPLDAPVAAAYADTLVFAPSSPEAARSALEAVGVPVRRFEKVEPDPALLRLRGFDEAEAGTPQRICTNLFPEGEAPLDFFVCDYAPFLRDRLSPARFPAPYGEVVAVEVRVPDPAAAEAFLARVGYAGVSIEFSPGDAPRVIALRFTDGARLRIEGFQIEG